eukprot:698011-Pyramimonas_sp.AAC.1
MGSRWDRIMPWKRRPLGPLLPEAPGPCISGKLTDGGRCLISDIDSDPLTSPPNGAANGGPS